MRQAISLALAVGFGILLLYVHARKYETENYSEEEFMDNSITSSSEDEDEVRFDSPDKFQHFRKLHGWNKNSPTAT